MSSAGRGAGAGVARGRAGSSSPSRPHPHPNQIIGTIAGLEHASECLDPAGHYTKGGEPGNLKFLKNCAPAAPPPTHPPLFLGIGVAPMLGGPKR